MRRLFVVGVAAVVALLGAGPGGRSAGAGERPVPEINAAAYMDLSPPLRDMLAAPVPTGLQVPRIGPIVSPGSPGSPAPPDPVLQATGPNSPVKTVDLLNFPGVGNGDYGFVPASPFPDANLAVGATQVVQWVNASFAVFDKATGAIAAGFPKAGNVVWSGLGGGCDTNNDGEPVVQYDKLANRWILTQSSISTTPYLQCVAVSTTSDATGSYFRYAFDHGSTNQPGEEKLGVWPDAYYVSLNVFDPATTTFLGAKVCAYDRASMLAGAPATQQCFQLSSDFGALLPSDLDGTIPPPAGTPNFLLNLDTTTHAQLNLWQFHVDWASPANTTLTGPTSIPVAPFTAACGTTGPFNQVGLCVPEMKGKNLWAFGNQLMYRLAYRSFASGHDSMVVNHAVNRGPDGITGIRWYELRRTGTEPWSIFQQGTYGSRDGIHRWFASMAMDKVGNIAVGYSASSKHMFPAIRYTGRVPKDPPGKLQGEKTVIAGAGSQTLPLLGFFWGTYTSMSVDPVDDCTFWYTNQYLKESGFANWSTQIASFKFSSCQ